MFHGLQVAADQLARGAAELCIAGGVDSWFNPDTLDELWQQGRIVMEDSRWAFFPGEAAAFVALASEGARKRLKLESLGRVRGVHVATEPNGLHGDVECLGQGLTAAIRGAAATVRAPQELIDRTVCDINGERYRADEWGFVALRAQQVFRDVTAYEAPADRWGDVGAASGALFAVLATEAWRRNYAPGPLALICAGSEGGLRGAALLEAPGEAAGWA